MSGFGDGESSAGAGAGGEETGKKMDVLSEATSSGFEDEEEVEYLYELLELSTLFLEEQNLGKEASCETDEERKVTMEYKIHEYHTKRMSLLEKIKSTDIYAPGFDGKARALTETILEVMTVLDLA